MAPRAGLEPATLRLTAECSTIELPRKILLFLFFLRTLCLTVFRFASHNASPYPSLKAKLFITEEIEQCNHFFKPEKNPERPGYRTAALFFISTRTIFAIAFSVSNTAIPFVATPSKSGAFFGLRVFFISCSSAAFGRSRLLY